MPTNDDDLLRGLANIGSASASTGLMERIAADAAFEAAKRDRPLPSELLTARILRDARAVTAARRRRDWRAVGGLVAACAVGLLIGFSDPGGLIATALPVETGYDQLAGAYEFQIVEFGE